MQQAIKNGLSFIGEELFASSRTHDLIESTNTLFEYSNIFSVSKHSRVNNLGIDKQYNDQVRLFILETFFQVLESGKIGIGVGSSSTVRKSSSNGNEANKPYKSKRDTRDDLFGNYDFIRVSLDYFRLDYF